MLNINDVNNSTPVRKSKKTEEERQAMLAAERRRLEVYQHTQITKPVNTMLADALTLVLSIDKGDRLESVSGRLLYVIDGHQFYGRTIAIDYVIQAYAVTYTEADRYLRSLQLS